jgi:purine-binding chemotaxis protein CheW
MATDKQRPDPRKSLVGFRIGTIEYAVPIHSVREIVAPLPITPLPHAPPAVAGVIDHRGEVIPIVDLRARLGLPRAELGPRGKWILLDVEGRRVGLAVDSVTEVFGTAGAELRPAPTVGHGDQERGIVAVAKNGGKMVFVLDVRNFEELTSPIVDRLLPRAISGTP